MPSKPAGAEAAGLEAEPAPAGAEVSAAELLKQFFGAEIGMDGAEAAFDCRLGVESPSGAYSYLQKRSWLKASRGSMWLCVMMSLLLVWM